MEHDNDDEEYTDIDITLDIFRFANRESQYKKSTDEKRKLRARCHQPSDDDVRVLTNEGWTGDGSRFRHIETFWTAI